MSSQNSPGNYSSLLTPPSPREDHDTKENPPLGTLTPSTMTAVFQEGFATASTMTAVFQEGFTTAPNFLAPADFGTTALSATTTTQVLETPPPVGVYVVMVCPWTDHILARTPLLEVEADLS